MSYFPSERKSIAIIAKKKSTCPGAYHVTSLKGTYPFYSPRRRLAYFRVFISEPRSRELAALRADSQLEKGRSPPRPLRPLGSGEQTQRFAW